MREGDGSPPSDPSFLLRLNVREEPHLSLLDLDLVRDRLDLVEIRAEDPALVILSDFQHERSAASPLAPRLALPRDPGAEERVVDGLARVELERELVLLPS
eukprot:TRINITY_DN3965_c0_g2_i1.p3 TRINITY_DN3965_c0_g2~~TRINITY_DN3965_c0_g2_i1.p3  ORF type:complete len:101 (-),score=14.04 TRINITY_DN3965_c0_g2_i1:630-932(-)